jgi:hypothetical protein
MTEYTLTIPDDVYRRARRIAEHSRLPVDAVMIDHLRTLPPTLPSLAPHEESELEALQHLSDDTLWTIAHERLGVEQEERLQALMDSNTFGLLEQGQVDELAQLVERSQRLLLRKSQAAALLVQRGHKIDPGSLTARD